MVKRGGTVDPSKHPGETFDLYSIPAYDRGIPDQVLGSEIGSSKQTVQPGDVLLSRIVPHIRRAWIVGAEDGKRLIASGEWIVFRSDKFDPSWLRYVLLSDRFHREFMATVAGVGGSLLRARPAQVALIGVSVPPLDEQRRIAAILDQADGLRIKRRAILAQLSALTQSIFVQMFGHSVPLAPIGDLCQLMVDCVNRTAPVVDGPTPYKMLRTTNVRDGRVDTSNVRYVEADTFARWNRRTTPQRGDVILTREAPVGEVGILDSDDQVFLGQRLFLYRPDPQKLTAEFLLAAFRSPTLTAQFERLGIGSTVKHLPLPACQNFLVPAAPLEQQIRFSARTSQVSELIAINERNLVQEELLFQALQQKAFAGQLLLDQGLLHV